MITIQQIKSIKPGQFPLDPAVDMISMGHQLGSNVFVTLMNHKDDHCKYLVLVNMETGERIRLEFDSTLTDGPSVSFVHGVRK